MELCIFEIRIRWKGCCYMYSRRGTLRSNRWRIWRGRQAERQMAFGVTRFSIYLLSRARYNMAWMRGCRYGEPGKCGRPIETNLSFHCVRVIMIIRISRYEIWTKFVDGIQYFCLFVTLSLPEGEEDEWRSQTKQPPRCWWMEETPTADEWVKGHRCQSYNTQCGW